MKTIKGMDMIYLDNSATTPLYPKVKALIVELMEEHFANPSSLYDLGIGSEKIIKNSRKTLAKTINAKEEEIYFTASGSESNNLAIKGIAKTYHKRGKHIITTSVEHPSVLRTMEALKEDGFEVTLLPVDRKGNINLNDVRNSLRKDTILLSMMMVNNEVGTIYPIKEVGELIKEENPDCLFHVDGVQSYGRLPIDMKKNKVDAFSFSGHKIGAPKGIGALYLREKLRLTPIIHGGGQEKGLRSGTENIYYIAALALAATLSLENNKEKLASYKNIKQTLLKELEKASIPYSINGNDDDLAAPYLVNIFFPKVTAEVLLHFLESKEIYVSEGSACHSKTKGSSETLTAMGKDDEERNSSLRFSFGWETKAEDMATVAKAIQEGTIMIKEMRREK